MLTTENTTFFRIEIWNCFARSSSKCFFHQRRKKMSWQIGIFGVLFSYVFSYHCMNIHKTRNFHFQITSRCRERCTIYPNFLLGFLWLTCCYTECQAIRRKNASFMIFIKLKPFSLQLDHFSKHYALLDIVCCHLSSHL